MKTEMVKKDVKEFSQKCPDCDKKIKGTSESQVEHNLLIHKIRLHPHRVKIEDVKK